MTVIDFIRDREQPLGHFVVLAAVASGKDVLYQLTEAAGERNTYNIEIKINGIEIDAKLAIETVYDRFNSDVENRVNKRIEGLLEGNEVFDKVRTAADQCESVLAGLRNWLTVKRDEERNG